MHSTKNIKEISNLLSNISDADLIEGLLNDLFTEKELNNLSSRWEIVKLLDQGLTQRKIAKDLHLSLCNITRGSKELNKKNSAIKKILRLIN
jgi:TrpR family transcriptional regulator, trp operon repressor